MKTILKFEYEKNSLHNNHLMLENNQQIDYFLKLIDQWVEVIQSNEEKLQFERDINKERKKVIKTNFASSSNA